MALLSEDLSKKSNSAIQLSSHYTLFYSEYWTYFFLNGKKYSKHQMFCWSSVISRSQYVCYIVNHFVLLLFWFWGLVYLSRVIWSCLLFKGEAIWELLVRTSSSCAAPSIAYSPKNTIWTTVAFQWISWASCDKAVSPYGQVFWVHGILGALECCG